MVRVRERERKGIVFPDDGRTKQAMRAECDVNAIIKRYFKTGILDHLAKRKGSFGDFEAMDYHTALNQVIQARDLFMSLPADLRKRFDNDPGAYLEFVLDPANADELVELGLATRSQVEPAAEPVAESEASPSEEPPTTTP